MIAQANVNIELDNKSIEQYIQKRIDVQIDESLFLVDVETLSKKCSMSRRFLEEEFLKDPRFKLIEKTKVRKRFYYWEEAKRVIEEIIEEW
ncbi:hypothetical protein BpOF4_03765 [Alkalihalophilus pseudofirmus OF4]|uniref:Uncharacterized protein n=1 Tax=Alkalihalophilus pseudofirmus (strain ATCC BAA-2126 / JCM 17055 / OF4) TaxID=398511 RepID=D3FX64_ALKPO|nr:hypothetical protein [Alkalihalophilus pseudofirmus]ADC48819.1 hypothetical protein BpOF4_03765 [Alkalihalophilus pseudofirmus OF4]